MNTISKAILLMGATLLVSCGPPPPAKAKSEARSISSKQASVLTETSSTSPLNLPELFDCLRENDAMLIAAHRGGPVAGYPENAIETMQHGYDNGIRVFEIDVAESRDGVLFLMHDNRLNRTSTGDGYVSDTDWYDISSMSLVDGYGNTTKYSPPKLTDALIWAREKRAILEIDRKPTTSFSNVASAVRAARAESNAIFITYNDKQAGEVARIDDTFMMTASAFGNRDITRLEQDFGVDRTRLIGWTGTRSPDDAGWKRLREEGVEPAFGTLGRRGERLDDVFLADDNPSEYEDLAKRGLVLLATDEPYRVTEGIQADDRARKACGL